MSYDCKGCRDYTNTINSETSIYCMVYMREEEYGRVIPRCPCMNCLVKGMCTDICLDYENHFKLIMTREYTRV